MENSQYINIIKIKIANKAKEYSKGQILNPSYFNTLFPEIEEDLKNTFKLLGFAELDSITLYKYYEIAKNEYLSVNPIDIDPTNSLTKEGYITWLTSERKEEMKDSWNYSNRYFTMLQKSGRSDKIVQKTIDTSLEILEKIGDPKSTNPFFVKGLVVGSVQSGKTENFNAVINRAIDAGYGLIIVLSGIMEDLRRQTQARIDNDVIGTGIIDYEKETKRDIGVGKIRKFGIRTDTNVQQVVAVTSYKLDFNKPLADKDFQIDFTNVLVCKKNVSILRNLIVWLHDFLEENKKHNIPLLILDDEADNASLNNEGKKGIEYASKINGHIRALLQLFNKKTYLGYTATPFANVLADRNEVPKNDWIVKYKLRGQTEEKILPRVDNLFPDDFIILLNPPSNYIGAKQLFETLKPIENKAQLKMPLIEVVNDHIESFPSRVYQQLDGSLIGIEKISNNDEWRDKFGEYGGYLDFSDYKEYRKMTRSSKPDDSFPKNLPNSIKESILCFVLSIAVRESRKPYLLHSTLYNPHNSMLIHVSRFTKWQNELKKLIDVYVKGVRRGLRNDKPNSTKSIYAELERIWYKYYANINQNIKDYLPEGYNDEFLTPISFDKLKNNFLIDAIDGLEVKAINSVTGDKLEYQKSKPVKVIAIGGNRLSRGFTLEGLTINYFVRSTDYSDTLLQMGRWFGYRPGYLDCCKLFITNDSIDKYDLITRTIEELEEEFRKMEEKGKTPQEFVIRVKKHPGTLKITRPSILKNVLEVKWSYQDSLVQTSRFNISKDKIEKVWTNFKSNICGKLKFTEGVNKDGNENGFLISETNIDGIINILSHENNFGEITCKSLIRYLDLCKNNYLLTNWTIAIKTVGQANKLNGKGNLLNTESNLDVDIKMSIRRGPNKDEANNRYRVEFFDKMTFTSGGKSANIVSGGKDLSILLDKKTIDIAEKEFIKDRKKYYKKWYPELTESQVEEKAISTTKPERIYRERMEEHEGLLLIYVLDSYYVFLQEKGIEDIEMKDFVEREGIDLNIPLIGYAIGIPPLKNDPGGIYVHGDYGIKDNDEIDDDDLENDDSGLPNDLNES